MLAVGEQMLPDIPASLLTRIANGFAGGVGRTRDEMCGALAGGVILIGLLCGRETTGQDDELCLDLVRQWRQLFKQRFGTTVCRPIFNAMTAPGGPQTCAGEAGEAAGVLWELLERANCLGAEQTESTSVPGGIR